MKKVPTLVPFALMPGTQEYDFLIANCAVKRHADKVRTLAKMSQQSLRAEVGSAQRFFDSTFRSLQFAAFCSGDFRLGPFLNAKGKLLAEKGRGVGNDTMRLIMGGIAFLTRLHAETRPSPFPIIRRRIDEVTNAGLDTEQILRDAAEANKWGLYSEFAVQRLDFRGGDDVLQLFPRKKIFRCDQYDLSRKCAIDIACGLQTDESRSELIERLTREIMNLRPGEHWVRDARGSRKEYLPMVENPWPSWPGLRARKIKERLDRIYARPEYVCEKTPETSSETGSPAPASSPSDASPAKRLKRGGKKRADGSENK